MFSTSNFSKLNTPKTYIFTAVSSIGIYLVPRVSIKLSILAGLSFYLYNVLTSTGDKKKKKKCCGGKNKSKTGKCCSGGDGSCCSKKEKIEKKEPKKGCCGSKSCSKKILDEGESKSSNQEFDEISTDFTAQFAKKSK